MAQHQFRSARASQTDREIDESCCTERAAVTGEEDVATNGDVEAAG
jgi:hypothetical protein